MTSKKGGFALIEVVMAFFLISLLGTMILLVYSMTISKYDDKRQEKKTYILMNNIHQEFMSTPEKFYTVKGNIESSGGTLYYDEHLRVCGSNDRFVYRVFYSVIVDLADKEASLYISNVEVKGKEVITNLSLGKMRITS